jgi:hypothetical protein
MRTLAIHQSLVTSPFVIQGVAVSLASDFSRDI